ncbi:MAG: universal stress protein [Chloroflexota bacterium]
MFKHIMVPLDGSRLAESVLPAALLLAQRFQARVTLVHVIEERPPATIHGERHLANVAEAEAYLDETAQRLRREGIQAETHVHSKEEDNVARGIAEHLEELGPDLIVISAHGSGGLRDTLIGSIAQQVLQRSTRPILLVRPTAAGEPPPFACRKLLLPLDGEAAHEAALPVAAAVAGACGSRVHLVQVVPTLGTLPGEEAASGMLMPSATRALLDLAQQGGEGYLSHIAEELRAAGLSVSLEVCRGDPASEVVQAAERAGADLVVMATHGRVAAGAFWAGSVAPKVFGRLNRPLLLVRVIP